jgi:hypothetical protein
LSQTGKKRDLELALLKTFAAPAERARLLAEADRPRPPTRKQRETLLRAIAAGGAIGAESVHYKTGLVMTARRWMRLENRKDGLWYVITDAGKAAADAA